MNTDRLIITIGRMNGSGGREVGQALADRLGMKCFDRTVITETAKKSGLTEEQVYENEEQERKGTLMFYGMPVANPLYQYQHDAIRRIAQSEGRGVFVGRSADYVLSGRPDTISIFISASPEECAMRSAHRNNISFEDAMKRTQNKNANRSAYYQRYTGRVWGSAFYYDLCLNTTHISIEDTVDLIIDYLRKCNYEV